MRTLSRDTKLTDAAERLRGNPCSATTGFADWVAVDWGTTHLRVWLMDKTGLPMRSASSEEGAGMLDSEEFGPALMSLIEDCLPEDRQTTVICCGMAGAKQGWVPAPYRMTPAPMIPLVSEICTFEAESARLRVHIVPGVAQQEPPDVMRGEETQIAGYFALSGTQDTTLCLPGTHSKWVTANNAVIETFQTFPTGELFSLFSKQSILRHSVSAETLDEEAFLQGVADAVKHPDRFLSEIFPIRAEDLLRGTSKHMARGRLSGLLIGLELANAHSYWKARRTGIIGAGNLAHLYARALSSLDVEAEVLDGEAMVLAGLNAIHNTIERDAA